METEKIKACMVSLADAPDAFKDLLQIITARSDPWLILSQVFPAVSDRPKVRKTVKAINRLKPKVIFIALSSSRLKQARFLITSLQEEGLKPDILAFLEDPTSDATIDMLKIGVADVICPPFAEESVVPGISRILDNRAPDEKLLSRLKEKLGLRKLIGRNAAFLAEVNKIPLIARCDATVLIVGETGTGKEIFARGIHYLSRRAAKPFVTVSCGAIPMELVENELFGHIKGAFTGAMASQIGLVGEAKGGTLFFDDIDCLPLLAQVKVLRLLQEKEYKQIGSTIYHHANVRVIAATNVDLERAAKEGKFRQDLFYRLNVIPLSLPPLRERPEDIPLLARHFLEEYAFEFKKETKEFTDEAIQGLLAYDWPGNVRELENVIERAVIFSQKAVISPEAIPLPSHQAACQESFKEAKWKAVMQFEKKYIEGLLAANEGNISKAARAAEKNRRAFWELIRKHKIQVEGIKTNS